MAHAIVMAYLAFALAVMVSVLLTVSFLLCATQMDKKLCFQVCVMLLMAVILWPVVIGAFLCVYPIEQMRRRRPE